MTDRFFEHPILNSPYEYPAQHWELDADGQPTNQVLAFRRRAEFVTPIPKPKKRRRGKDDGEQQILALFDTEGISDGSQTYDLSLFINSVRDKVNAWRQLP
ncbi:MAG: restriction endonuclease, partial [Cyanobacteria bacterium]|nr:restriction endonuclease [Cyanobacteriota bacterium]